MIKYIILTCIININLIANDQVHGANEGERLSKYLLPPINSIDVDDEAEQMNTYSGSLLNKGRQGNGYGKSNIKDNVEVKYAVHKHKPAIKFAHPEGLAMGAQRYQPQPEGYPPNGVPEFWYPRPEYEPHPESEHEPEPVFEPNPEGFYPYPETLATTSTTTAAPTTAPLTTVAPTTAPPTTVVVTTVPPTTVQPTTVPPTTAPPTTAPPTTAAPLTAAPVPGRHGSKHRGKHSPKLIQETMKSKSKRGDRTKTKTKFENILEDLFDNKNTIQTSSQANIDQLDTSTTKDDLFDDEDDEDDKLLSLIYRR